MRNITLSVFSVFCAALGFSQTQFSKDYESVRTELVTWDAVRGEWLANSFEAMVNKQAIPPRTFPEDLTPEELFRMVPKQSKERIQTLVTDRENKASESVQRDAWRRIAVLTGSNACKPVSARSYGDPHLVSFDGASFSFQTVGEFVMAKSASGHMEVQARQRAEGNDFSLNTAIAMNVSGDRLCFYANEKPDSDRENLFRLNGNPIRVENTYHLPHGGTIVKSGRKEYIVSWPSGERVIMDLNTLGSMDFVNLTLEIIPCLDEQFSGVFGNANRNVNDDFRTRTGRSPKEDFVTFVSNDPEVNRIAQDIEREHLSYIAKDFADEWRVTDETTLFDYGFGENTLTYTNRFFPQFHRTVRDLTPDQQTAARRSCEEAGIRGSDLQGCIYDRGFLNIPATPRPVVRDRTEGLVLARVDKPVAEPVVDPGRPKTDGVEEKPQDEVTPTSTKTGGAGKTNKEDPKPVKEDKKPVKESSDDVKFDDIFNTGTKKPSSSSSSGTKGSGTTTTSPTKTSTPVKTSTSTPTKSSSTPVSNPTKPTSTPTKTSTPTPTKGNGTISSPVRKGK
ncbi:MAG: VWD domain-containing protein [Bacteroidota bacterium]